jgi:hypothetical protein
MINLEIGPRQVVRFEKFQSPLGFEVRVRNIPERRTYNVILVWSYPARGLCSPEYAPMSNGAIQGAYYHGNGGCQTVDIISCSGVTNTRKSEWFRCRYQRTEPVYILRDLRTDPESDQADRASLELESHRGFVVLPRRVPDWPGSKVGLIVPSSSWTIIRQSLINTYH